VEVAPHIHRIESVLGPRPFSQYLIRGERSMLVDTGCADTPAAVILPFLDGHEPDLVLVSHADVDHFGGNHAIREAAPRSLLLAHALDTPWIESAERILRERYSWYAEHGLAYPPDVFDWLAGSLGPDVPVDVQLQGGERLRLGAGLTVEILHLPGHTPGHLGVWEPASRTAIVMDAVMGRGLLDLEGNVIHPPPYADVAGYEGAARTLQALRPVRLLTAHYEVMEGADVDRFLAATLDFIADARRCAAASLAREGSLSLADALACGDASLGPFTSMPNELAGTMRAHLRELVAAGRAVEDPSGLRWTSTASTATGGS
jgi:glyoxylase-like metal-dependent hydrolase (beta-lactamase superfamily II)